MDTRVGIATRSSNGLLVTYTGCVQSRTQTRTYVLDKVVPVRQTTETASDAAGTPTATTTTTYALVPSDTVQIPEYVGHKVEVTGMVVPTIPRNPPFQD